MAQRQKMSMVGAVIMEGARNPACEIKHCR